MNSKVYRLLRNNKEQGPFTSEDLIAKGLKPYDLIWVDGRSAAWRYPGEMNEFKNYVPDPDNYLNNLIITKQQETIARVSNAVQAAVAMNDNIVQATKQKPRYKVSAAWSKIQTITTQAYSNTNISETKKYSKSRITDPSGSQPLNARPLSWEQAWKDWEKEKETVVPVKTETVSTIAVPVKRPVNESVKATPALEKKFEQSLDTLTDSYIDNLLLQKKKAKRFSFGKSSEFILPSLALILIFSIGYWLLHDTKASAFTGSAIQQQTATNSNEQPKSNLNTTAANDNSGTSQTSQQKQINSNISDEAVEKPVAKEKSNQFASNTKFVAPVKANNEAPNDITQKNSTAVADVDLKKNADKTIKQFDPSVINNVPRDNSYNDASAADNGDLNAAENRPVRRRTNGADVSNTQPTNQVENNNPITTKGIKATSATDYVSVPEYVSMNDGNGSLKIQNTSDDNLDLVVIDVQYYDASGRYRKGETMNLHNLKAGKSVTIKMPRDINSSYATSKVSLVSSEADNVYAVGDN